MISKNSLKNHLNADDTQLYISFTPTNSALSLETLTTTFNDILSWMNLNKLLLNPIKNRISSHWHKTTTSQIFWSNKLISQQWYHPSQFLCSQSWLHLWLWHVFVWSNPLSIQSCHFHIRDIRQIRHLLPLSTATAFANSLVSSKLNYCNSLYSGISQKNLKKLQRIQNSLEPVITNTSKYQHITPTLKKQHWLPIKQRIDYKLLSSNVQNTNKSTTYISFTIVFLSFISVTFCFYTIFWLTCSFHSICPIITWQKGFLCHRSTTLEFTPSWYPKLVFSTNIPFQAQNTPLQNCVPSYRRFPHLPWLSTRSYWKSNTFMCSLIGFLLTLCLQDHLIHRFCPSLMSEHLWVKGLFLSLLQGSGTPSH